VKGINTILLTRHNVFLMANEEEGDIQKESIEKENKVTTLY
jgi:hypothetical protein